MAITAALLLFAWIYISSLVRQATFSEISINWLLFLLSIAFFIGYYGLMSVNWLIAASMFDPTVKRNQLLVFLASQPYKYLPTSLFIFSSRAVFAKRLGMSYKKSSLAQLFENGALIAANFSLFIILYLIEKNTALGLGLLLIIMLASLFVYKRKELKVKFRKLSFEVDTVKLTSMFYVCFVGWLLCGLSFSFFNLSLGISIDLLVLLAANTLAFSLSMLAIFAPGGIGVRELVYDRFSINKAAIIYWRILVFCIDMLIGIPSIFLLRKLSKKN